MPTTNPPRCEILICMRWKTRCQKVNRRTTKGNLRGARADWTAPTQQFIIRKEKTWKSSKREDLFLKQWKLDGQNLTFYLSENKTCLSCYCSDLSCVSGIKADRRRRDAHHCLTSLRAPRCRRPALLSLFIRCRVSFIVWSDWKSTMKATLWRQRFFFKLYSALKIFRFH